MALSLFQKLKKAARKGRSHAQSLFKAAASMAPLKRAARAVQNLPFRRFFGRCGQKIRSLYAAAGRQARRASRGMTLLEIMIVVAIIGVVMATLMNAVMRRRAKAKVSSAKIALNVLSQNVEEFNMDCGFYPENIKDLLNAPQDCGEWDGPYVKEKHLKDPWNSAIIYEYNADDNTYELISLGADKREGGDRNNKDISSDDL